MRPSWVRGLHDGKNLLAVDLVRQAPLDPPDGAPDLDHVALEHVDVLLEDVRVNPPS